jgi:hypothetical protein
MRNLLSLKRTASRNDPRHAFVIGPSHFNPRFGRRGRLYYCYRCKWNFLVCGKEVLVLDNCGRPLAGDESARRFTTFALGPCPVLAGLVREMENRSSGRVVEATIEGCASPNGRHPGERPDHSQRVSNPKPRPVLRLVGRFSDDGRRVEPDPPLR